MEGRVERTLMSEEEFKEYLEKNRIDPIKDLIENNMLHLKTFDAVHKYKSVRRAIKRGKVAWDGSVYPKRPFNNRANTSHRKGCHSREFNELKKRIYGQLKHKSI